LRDDRIGKILVDLGYLSSDRLFQAENSAITDHQKFGEHLCRLGFIREDDIRHALAVQYGIPQADLKRLEISSQTLACLPAELAERYRVLPIAREDGRLGLAMADPFDFSAIDDLSAACGLEIERWFARESELSEALRRCYGTSSARMADSLATQTKKTDGLESDESIGQLHELVREPSLINLVNLIIMEAVQEKASDIHVEPFEHQLKVKYRIDGILHEMAPPPKHLQAAIISRIKIMAQLNIAERFLPQDGHIKFNASDVQVDIRVSTVPTMFGESVVMRILNKTSTLRMLGQLGMDEYLLDSFDAILCRPHGILLVTGPTGSGKTSTLYASLHHIYTPAKKIITIEDPVEFFLEGINQIQVNPKRGLTFANGLRSILRQDPDIIMVGEIRDGETADIAIRSALTGHMVFSSLHTNDAAGAITRLLDMGIEPFLLATTVEGVVAQRLVRILCDRCAEEYEPSPQVLHQLGPDAEMFAGKKLRQAKGCQDCHHTGYSGRIGIFEMIRLNDAIREIVMDRPSSNQVRRAAGSGFVDMRHDGYRKVLAGVTTLEEVWRVTQDVQQNGTTLEGEI
jgi:type II secretion system protein E